MIYSQINIENETNFTFIPLHQSTWVYYLKQYIAVLDYLLGIANKKRYRINCQYMPFMFIFRHTVELFLKTLLYDRDKVHINTHKLADVYEPVKDLLPLDFKERIDVLDWNGNGSEFRYIEDRENKRYFSGEQLKAYYSCAYFVEIYNKLFPNDMMIGLI